MLDRDEAERLPVVIPQEDIGNAPEAFAWYEGPQGGGFTVPYQFKKYRNRPVNETPMGYLHYIVDKCNEYTKNIHSAFFDAIQVYFEGLMEYARDHYAGFVIPFGTKHRGKRLQQCRDKPWIEWTTTKPSLTEKYTVYFKAVQYFLADTRHYNANRDIGQLLSATEYEDDLDLEEEEDDEYENDSFIDDGSIEEEREGESSEAADKSEASSSIEESTQASDAESSQSCISDDFDSEPYMQTPPREIPLNGTASLGSAYRLGKCRDSSSPSPALPPPSTLRKRRRASPDFDASPLVSPISKANSASKASPRRFPSVDSLDHPEDSDDAEEDKPEARQQSRRRKRGPPKAAHRPRKGKQKALTSEMENFLSGSEESDGNEDYAGSATENLNLSDLADGAQSRQLRSGRKYGPNKSTPSKEIASKESSPRGIGPARPTKVEISSAVDSGSDEPNKLSTRSTPRRTSNPGAQASSSKRRRTAYRVVSSSDDGSRSPSPERPAHRFRRLRRWSERTA